MQKIENREVKIFYCYSCSKEINNINRNQTACNNCRTKDICDSCLEEVWEYSTDTEDRWMASISCEDDQYDFHDSDPFFHRILLHRKYYCKKCYKLVSKELDIMHSEIDNYLKLIIKKIDETNKKTEEMFIEGRCNE